MPKSSSKFLVERFQEVYKRDPLRFDDLPGITPSWNPLKLMTLYNLIKMDAPPGNPQISQLVKLHRTTVTRKLEMMDWPDFERKLQELCDMSHEEYLNSAAKRFRDKNNLHQSVVNRRQEIRRVAAIRDMEQRLITTAQGIRVEPMRIKPAKRDRRTPEHMCIALSDSHVGLEFTSEETGGLGEYNVDMFKSRCRNLCQGVLTINDLHTELYRIPQLHVLCLGDMVQGANNTGAWGPAYISIDVNEQIRVAAESMASMISTWSRYFQRVNVYGVIGNHGRAAEKNMDKLSANFDNMVYAFVKALLKDHKNVVVDYTPSWWQQVSVNEHEFLLVHGDYISKSMNRLVAEEQRLQSLVSAKTGKSFENLIMGHFHTHGSVETNRGEIMLNGSFVGGDIYSMHQLRSRSKPTQTIFGVHPENGVTWRYNLNLDHHKTKEMLHKPSKALVSV